MVSVIPLEGWSELYFLSVPMEITAVWAIRDGMFHLLMTWIVLVFCMICASKDFMQIIPSVIESFVADCCLLFRKLSQALIKAFMLRQHLNYFLVNCNL